MGIRDWATAATAFERATEAAHAAQLASGEAVAQALLATCRAELGDVEAADRAAARAAGLRSRVTVRQEVFMVDIALAQLRAARPLAGGTTVALTDLAADADRRGWIGWSLEARLAAIDGRSDPGRVLRNAFEKDAHAHGFEWVVRRAERLPDAPKATAHG
jgi:hypothetical protein